MTNSGSTLDDAAVERLLTGRTLDGRPELEPVTMLVRALGGLAADLPAPRGDLAALLAAGFDPADAPAAADDVPVWAPSSPTGSRVLRHPVTRLAGLSLAAKVLLGSGVAAAGVTSAAGAGVLPDPVQNSVSAVVEAVTPFEVPRSAPVDAGSPRSEPGTGPTETSRPSVPAGPPSSLPAAPVQAPGAPDRTAPAEQAPEQAGRPTSVPGRTARPEQAPPAPARSEPAPSRAADPAPPTQQSPGSGREQAPGQQQAPAPPAGGPTAPADLGEARPEVVPAPRR